MKLIILIIIIIIITALARPPAQKIIIVFFYGRSFRGLSLELEESASAVEIWTSFD